MIAAGLRLPAGLATMSDAPEPSTKKRRGFGRPAQEGFRVQLIFINIVK